LFANSILKLLHFAYVKLIMSQIPEDIINIENLIKQDPKNFVNYFNLGNVYRKLGKYELSLKNFLKSVELNKDFYQGYNNIGNIYKELKNTKSSIEYFQKAIGINSNYISALYNLAIVFFEAGKYKEASTYFKRVLKIDPRHLASLNNFGILLRKVQKHEEAIKCFEKIIDIDKNFLKAYNNIGTISLELGNVENAISNYEKVMKLDPNNFVSYKNLLAVYENTNQIENYNKILKLSEKKFPEEKILKLYKGILFFRKNKFKESVELLSKSGFEKENEMEKKRIFFLAKAYDRIDKTTEAFKFFKLGNKLENSTYEAKQFDKNRYLKNIEKKKDYFTKENISKWRKIKLSSYLHSPVFLIGFPRSGTTLLDTILRSHPKIEIIEEKPMVLKMISKIKNNNIYSLEDISDQEIKYLRKEYFNELQKHINFNNKSTLYIDKLPLNIINVGEILRIFPNSKFILSLRHPMDCVLSCFMQDFKLNDAMSNFMNLKDAAILYKKTMDLWGQYTSVLKVNYIPIKYENLIKNLKPSIKEILKFLNLDWDKSLLNYRDAAVKRGKISTPSYYQVIQPIYEHSNQRWKRYKKHLTNIQPTLNTLIKKYKY